MRKVQPWSKYLLALCTTVAERSKDPSTQVGAVIARENAVLGTGYNGFPRGVKDTPTRWERPLKYDLVVHAEMNAIATAARFGHALDGATIYVPFWPCSNCAKHIIQAGIREVVINATVAAQYTSPKDHGFDLTKTLFEEAGVKVRLVVP